MFQTTIYLERFYCFYFIIEIQNKSANEVKILLIKDFNIDTQTQNSFTIFIK
jgi:hypothetical protein